MKEDISVIQSVCEMLSQFLDHGTNVNEENVDSVEMLKTNIYSNSEQIHPNYHKGMLVVRIMPG